MKTKHGPNIVALSKDKLLDLLDQSIDEFDCIIQTPHSIAFEQNNQRQFVVRLPLPFPPLTGDINEYLEEVRDKEFAYLMLLVQAGHASIGYFHDELVLHKIITRYMVRGKGKAQTTYLKQKGKSKAGSRIRLAQTIDFFEKINEKVDEWGIIEECDAIVYSASIQYWNLLLHSKVRPAFDKDDARLRDIPYDIHTPNIEEMQRIHDLGQQAQVLIYEPKLSDYFAPFMI